MLECVLPSRQINSEFAIDISWGDVPVGTKGIVDKAGNVWSSSTTTFNSGVVYDANKGNVFRSFGDVYFRTPIVEKLFLSKRSFKLEYEILPVTTTSNNLGGTGDYNEGISSGIGLNFGQFSNRWFQAFLMGPGTTYSRLYPLTPAPTVWTRVEIIRKYGTGFTMNLYRNGESTPYATGSVPEIDIGNGTTGYWWMFRQSNSSSGFFNGYINYFKLSFEV